MFILGHVGLTVAAAHAVDHDVDLRWAAFLALAPDILDKPIAWLAPTLVDGGTKNVGHTALAALVVWAALRAFRARKAMLLGACYAGHFLLDLMWLDGYPIVFFWPLRGAFPATPLTDPTLDRRLLAYNLAGELIGLILLIDLARRGRVFERPRFESFLKTGRLQYIFSE
jgi:hypothetical protein